MNFKPEVVYDAQTGTVYMFSNNQQDSTLLLSNWPNAAFMELDELPSDYMSSLYKVNLNTMKLELIKANVRSIYGIQ